MQIIKILTRFLMFIPLALGLAACDGGGGGAGAGAPPVTNNLSATALQVVTADPKIAYPLKVSVSITADEAADNVSLSLFAIEKNDDPDVVIRQFPLGSQTILQVEAGARSYEVEMNIPSSVELPGPYFIAVIVDPVDEVAETDEDDNTALIETTLSAQGEPNILLTEVALDRTVLDINTSTYEQEVPGTVGNVHNSDAGGTITVAADGLGVNETIDIEAFAKLRLMRADNGTSHDVPLYLWNSDAGRYTNAFGIDPAASQNCGPFVGGCVFVPSEWLPLGQFTPQLVETAGEEVTVDDVNRDSAHMNFYLPGMLGSELEIAMRHLPVFLSDPSLPPPDLTPGAIQGLRSFLRNLPSNGITGDESEAMAMMSFAICVEIRSVDSAVVDSLPADNEICSPLAITLPPNGLQPPVPPILPTGFTPQFSKVARAQMSGDGYGTKGGGSAFGFTFDSGSSWTADYRGYIEERHFTLSTKTFGVTAEFMALVARAQLVPDYAGKPQTEKPGYTLELRHNGAMLLSISVPPIEHIKKRMYVKELAQQEYTAFVGPVPVIGGGGIAGSLGYNRESTFTNDPIDGYKLGNTIGPFANIEALVFAGVGNPLFSAGVEGVLTLLNEELTHFSGTEIDVLDLGFQSGIAEFVITQDQTISNNITGPKGALNLFAKYSVPKVVTCSWGIVKGKCIKRKTIKAIKNLWKSKSLFHREDILFESIDEQLDVVVIPGQSPAYFVP